MKHILDVLSGNVPGGIYLYLVVLTALFFIFYYFYRTSELFSKRHFLRWFLGSWVILTLIYGALWWRHFPEQYFLKRYTVEVVASHPEDAIWAYYLRDEVSARVAPYQNRWTYFFPQRWLYLAHVDCNANLERCQHILQSLPVESVVKLRVERKSAATMTIKAEWWTDGEVRSTQNFNLSLQHPFSTVQHIIEWASRFIPVQKGAALPSLNDSLQILARDRFFRGDFEQSYVLYKKSLQTAPGDSNMDPWYQFVKIRYALFLKAKEGWVNPLDKDVRPWQKLVRQARQNLLQLLKNHEQIYMNNAFLNMMIGESFILEERFGDAEVFLKNAYIHSPFNVEILENLSHLHYTRLETLNFKNKYDVWHKILTYCPVYEDVLVAYVEFLLNVHPIQGDPPIIARQLMNRYLQLNPQSPTIWNLLGKYYLMTRRYGQAVRAFERADSLNPHNSLTKYNLGVAYYNLKDYNKAKIFFAEAIKIDDFLDAHLYLGQIYREEGDCQRALKEFRYRVAHKRGPEDPYAFEAMKGIRDCLKKLGISIPEQKD